MKYLMMIFVMLIVSSVHAADELKDIPSLPHTESATLPGVGTVTVTLTQGEAIDSFWIEASLTCVNKNSRHGGDLPRQKLFGFSVCAYTSVGYDANVDDIVVGHHALFETGQSKCNPENVGKRTSIRARCADQQRK
jgi:hypothetical protein